MNWRTVTSKKPRREGEVFILYGDVFVMKVYAGSVDDPQAFADAICKGLNRVEEKRNAQHATR